VVQIINKDEVHPLPAAGRRIRGAVYYSEQAVPVLSPADLNWIVLGQAGEEGGDFSLVIVAETARGLLGFGCDRVVQMSKREVGEAPREAARAHGPASGARVYELEAEKVLQYLS
jgi:chemotaxis signal transduction protein